MDTGFRITATHIAYFFVCHRKLWLYANGIEMEHFSDLVLEGRQIHKEAYPRRATNFVEIQLDGVKIDFFDQRARVVHETKRGRAIEMAHISQLQYYLFKLWNWGVKDATGIIEYPELRRKHQVDTLDVAMVETIRSWEKDIVRIVVMPKCPAIPENANCRNCAFFDLCHITET
jgi:CRISPR-associated exonuclease Cas4